MQLIYAAYIVKHIIQVFLVENYLTIFAPMTFPNLADIKVMLLFGITCCIMS